jgi:hypothetical protein
MKCGFKPSAPALTFSLEYEATYAMDFSVEQSNWPPHELDLFLRLQLDQANAKPMYMGSRYLLPRQLEPKETVTLTAQFPLSPGDWRVEALAVDEAGKVCHDSWRVQAKDLAPIPTNHQQKLRRITVFVASDPIYQKLGSLPSSSIEVLAGIVVCASALGKSRPVDFG